MDQGHGPRASAPAGYEDGAVLVESSQHFLLPGFPPPHDVPPSRLRGNTGARAEESRPQLRPAGALAERGAEGGAQTGRKMARRALSSSHLPTQSIFRVTAYSFPRLLQTPRPGPTGSQQAGTTQSRVLTLKSCLRDKASFSIRSACKSNHCPGTIYPPMLSWSAAD